MPSVTNTNANLVMAGPCLPVVIQPPQTLVHALAGRPNAPPLPPPVNVTAMIDTGAQGTVITPQVAQALGLQPVGIVLMSTPSTQQPVPSNQYNVDLFFPIIAGGLPNVLVIEAPLAGQQIQCLIGRDVLRHGMLIYMGFMNQFTLSF